MPTATVRHNDPASQASDPSFYDRTPALVIDSEGVVLRLNAACRELFGLATAGCQGRPIDVFEQRLGVHGVGGLLPAGGLTKTHFRRPIEPGGVAHGIALATAEIRVATSSCRLTTQRFGNAHLRVSEMPRIDANGRCSGAIVSLEVRELEDLQGFQLATDRRLVHELMWEVYAASCDRILPALFFYREVLERHAAALDSKSFDTILDLGAGTGNLAVRLLDRGQSVTAVDTSRAMLARLVRKLDDSPAGRRLTIIEDTAESLPQFADSTFDAVNVLLAFFDMGNPFLALDEAVRVLKPGGLLVSTEPRACFQVEVLMQAAEESLRANGLMQHLEEDWKRIESVAPLIRDSVLQERVLDHAPLDAIPWNAEILLDRLGHRGFKDLSFQESHLGNCATVSGRKPAGAPAAG